MNQPPLLNFTGVSKIFVTPDGGDITALSEVTFFVAPREFVSVIGSSGSGKATILRLAAGLEFPTRGWITLRGEPIDGPARMRDKIGKLRSA